MAVSDTLIGTLFDGRYQVVRKLGAGGMANVYLAEDQELGRRVAIKILNDRHANDEQFVERFRREAKNAAALSHPNIVSIYDRGEAEGTYYIAMEYLDGRSLKELIVSRGPAPMTVAIEYARQILSALRFAHRHGIVHRDIKPHNVLVDAEGRVKVTDFGIARAGASQMTEAGSIVGTAQYLSPEQARGTDVDQRSDLYSLGIVLYELLTGKVPFTGDTPVEIAMKHLSQTPEPPSAIAARRAARARPRRHARARQGSRRAVPERRGDGRRPRAPRARRRRLRGDRGVGDADHARADRPDVGDGRDDDRAAAARVVRAVRLCRRRCTTTSRSRSTGGPIWPWIAALIFVVGAARRRLVPLRPDLEQARVEQGRPGRAVRQHARDAGAREDQRRRLQPGREHHASRKTPAGFVFKQRPDRRHADPEGRSGEDLGLDRRAEGRGARRRRPAVDGRRRGAERRAPQAATCTRSRRAQPAGQVTAQDPAAGTKQPEGSSVRINVSKGPTPVSVPSVVGEPIATATSALQALGFKVSPQFVDSSEPANNVISQSPAGGHLGGEGLDRQRSPSRTARRRRPCRT